MLDPKIVKSRAQEKRLASLTGGTLNAGSGSGWKRKNDVRSPGVLWECKRTDNVKQITVKVSDLEGVRKEAIENDRMPAFHVEIGDRRYVILAEHDYVDLHEAAQHSTLRTVPRASR